MQPSLLWCFHDSTSIDSVSYDSVSNDNASLVILLTVYDSQSTIVHDAVVLQEMPAYGGVGKSGTLALTGLPARALCMGW